MYYPFKEQVLFAGDGEANGESTPIWVKGVDAKTLQIGGTFAADVTVKARLDPSLTFEDISITLSAPGIVQISGTYDQIRLAVTNYVSGTIVAFVAGQLAQQG